MRYIWALCLALTFLACGESNEATTSSPAADTSPDVASDTGTLDASSADTVNPPDTTADAPAEDVAVAADVIVSDDGSEDALTSDVATPDVVLADCSVSDTTPSDVLVEDAEVPDPDASDVAPEDAVPADVADSSAVEDVADPEGCTLESDGAPCDDSDPCTMYDACSAGDCTGAPADLDEDGFVDQACGGYDCNDLDTTVHPGAIEICDGQQNDCMASTIFGEETWESADLTITRAYCNFTQLGCEPGTAVSYYQACWPNEQPYTELCGDEADNDCDGNLDEGC
jgi:hypothetical protein